MFLFLEQQAADSALRMSSVAPTQCMPYLSDMWQALGMYLARAHKRSLAAAGRHLRLRVGVYAVS